MKVLRVAATFVEVFEEAGDAIAEIDVVAGLADIARNAPVPYVRPIILGGESGKISLKGSRHPLVEAQDGIDFIKNNCEMVRGESWFQIVTGPNMGGKSTFIRQVGESNSHSKSSHIRKVTEIALAGLDIEFSIAQRLTRLEFVSSWPKLVPMCHAMKPQYQLEIAYLLGLEQEIFN